jgi:hypothetical protein
VGIDALAAQGLEVGEDLADADDGGFGAFDVDGVGAKIDAHAERVFHEAEVFIASPEEGLEVGRDLQSDFQRVRWPPRGRAVEVSEKPEKQPSGAKARVDITWFMYGLKPVPFNGQVAECEGKCGMRGRRGPKLWAAGESGGLE